MVEEFLPETGEYLMMNKVLLNPEKEKADPAQRKYLFKTTCKVQGKCCKMVIDNIVSIEMVENMSLKRNMHYSIQCILVT